MERKVREGIPMTDEKLKDFNQVWKDIEIGINNLYKESSNESCKVNCEVDNKMVRKVDMATTTKSNQIRPNKK